MGRRLLLFTVLLLACAHADVRAQAEMRFRRLTEAEGLSHNGVTCFAQDRSGYMWIGTSEGLNRFDGYTCRSYRYDANNPHSLTSNDISSIHVGSRGDIWIATTRSGLNRYDPDHDGFVRYLSKKSDTCGIGGGRIAVMLEDGPGDLWIGLQDCGIDRYDRARDRFTHFRWEPVRTDRPVEDFTISGFVDAQGDPVFTTNTGIIRFDRSSQRFIRLPGLSGLLRARDGSFWCRTAAGMFEHRDAEWRLLRSYGGVSPHSRRDASMQPADRDASIAQLFQEDARGALTCASPDATLALYEPSQDRFTSITPRGQYPDFGKLNQSFIDSHGVLWMAASSGLYRFDAEHRRFQRFSGGDGASGLAGTRMARLFEDRSGVIWVGSFEGGVTLCERVERRFTTVRVIDRDQSGNFRHNVRAIAGDPSGDLWVGALSGLTRFDPALRHYRVIPCDGSARDGPGSRFIGSLYRAGDTTLWVGTWDGALSSLDLRVGGWTQHPYQPLGRRYLNPYGIRSLHVTPDGVVWLGTTSNLLIAYDPRSRKSMQYTIAPGVEDGAFIFTIAPDRHGRLLLGTDHGLYCFDPVSRHLVQPTSDGRRTPHFLDRDVRAIHEDARGTLWVGTSGDGLFVRRAADTTWTAIREEDGLPNNTVYAILPDRRDGLWISTNRGLCRLDTRSGEIRRYDELDGLQGGEFNTQAACALPDGRLCFGGVNGLNVFHPDSIRERRFRPPVVISAFRVSNEQRTPVRDTVHLTHSEDSFSFEFSALDFSRQHRSQYAYRLEGVDTGWVYSGTRRFVSYSNVDPGTYTFRVRARSAEGLDSETAAALTIVIALPWWRSPLALGLYTVLVLGSIYSVNRVMRARVIRRERAETRMRESQLRAQTAEAYARALQSENERKELELVRSRELASAYRALEESMQQLTRTQQALVEQEKLASLGQLTAGIAHEIKNPLNFIINFTVLARELLAELHTADMTTDRTRIMRELMQNLARIEEHGERADAILHRMMMHTRGAPGTKKPENINGLLREAVLAASDGMRARLDSFSIAVDARMDPDLPPVPVVADHFSLVLMNLLQNAMYAAHHHARSGGGAPPRVIAETRRNGEGVEIRICDNGPGVPSDLQARIFEPFFTTKPGSDGTGLGLSISHDIIKSHGGTLTLAQNNGAATGATFIVKLPGG
jgi:signal transduction histidine kinase/ligand-binding sensor domain-containing protein